MNLLLDTHVALWCITDDKRLKKTAKKLIGEPSSIIWVSVASIWEIAIKHALTRGDMPISGKAASRFFDEAGYLTLPIKAEHASAVEELPAIHQDPFDRLLVAQANVEPMHLVTHDPLVARYSGSIILV